MGLAIGDCGLDWGFGPSLVNRGFGTSIVNPQAPIQSPILNPVPNPQPSIRNSIGNLQSAVGNRSAPVAPRDGAFCAHIAVKRLTGDRALRASLGLGSTAEHVDRLPHHPGAEADRAFPVVPGEAHPLAGTPAPSSYQEYA